MVLTAFLFGAYQKSASMENKSEKLLVWFLVKALNRIPPFLRDRQVLEPSTLLVVVA